jgi:hydrogenase/urease accessory protein HupE
MTRQKLPVTFIAAVFTTLLCAALCAASISVQAHEVRPAYLELQQVAEDEYAVTWKQPVAGNMRLALEPQFPPACQEYERKLPEHTGAALIERWRIRCELLTGTVTLAGLSRTLTDVMLVIRYLDGSARSELLRADRPSVELADPAPALSSYLYLGIEHMLFGIDHILFVVALVLFIRDPIMLLKTITAFTAAHSITLALSVLQLVQLPQQPVEAVIALSIVFMARELVVAEELRSAITRLRPWLMAFLFGLLHGFGFAGALLDIGLPAEDLAGALLLFNVGIELGQLLVIGALLGAGWLTHRISSAAELPWQRSGSIMMGCIAAYWTIDRLWLLM